jgi:hypothetical protein
VNGIERTCYSIGPRPARPISGQGARSTGSGSGIVISTRSPGSRIGRPAWRLATRAKVSARMTAASVVRLRQCAAERLGEERRVPDLEGEPDGRASLARDIRQHLADELTDRLVDLLRFGEGPAGRCAPDVPARHPGRVVDDGRAVATTEVGCRG